MAATAVSIQLLQRTKTETSSKKSYNYKDDHEDDEDSHDEVHIAAVAQDSGPLVIADADGKVPEDLQLCNFEEEYGYCPLDAVATVEEQKLVVADQIEAGFSVLEDYNEERKEEIEKKVQDEKAKLVDEILEEAAEEAAEIIEEKSKRRAAKEVAEVYEDAVKEVEEVCEHKTEGVAEIAEVKTQVDIANEQIKENLIEDLLNLPNREGSDINDVVVEANLPFSVQTPSVGEEHPEEKLDRIVNRSGESVKDIKKDPEFDSFLNGILQQFT